MKARNLDYAMQAILARYNINIRSDSARILRLAQLTLRRWAERECGDSNDYRSCYVEEREDGTAWEHVSYHYTNKFTKQNTSHRIPNRAAGARKRVAEVCKRNGLHYFEQTDPRGCALYVGLEVLTDQNYSRACCCIV